MINFLPHPQQIAINLLPISIIYQLLFVSHTQRHKSKWPKKYGNP